MRHPRVLRAVIAALSLTACSDGAGPKPEGAPPVPDQDVMIRCGDDRLVEGEFIQALAERLARDDTVQDVGIEIGSEAGVRVFAVSDPFRAYVHEVVADVIRNEPELSAICEIERGDAS